MLLLEWAEWMMKTKLALAIGKMTMCMAVVVVKTLKQTWMINWI